MSGYTALPTSSQGVAPDDDGCKPAHLQKTDILKWLQQSAESDAAWVLKRFAEISPHLFRELHSESTQGDGFMAGTIGPVEKQSAWRRGPRSSMHTLGTGALLGDPIVQFSSPVFYAVEGVDSRMLLDVLRIGNQEGTSEVSYETRDESALQGRSYVATSGRLVFAPGVTLLQIEIPIIDNSLWDTTTEFTCILKHDDAKGATIGHSLSSALVKIIDNNYFPTDEFANLITDNEILDHHKWPLLFGYFKLVTRIPSVFQGTIKFILVDFVHNLWGLFHLFMNVYILDFVVDTSRPVDDQLLFQDRIWSLATCAFITIVAVALFHFLDYRRTSFPVISPARNYIQSALLRKFLNYTTTVRECISPWHVLRSIEHDSDNLATFGYLNMLKVFNLLGKMLCTVTFKLLAPFVVGGHYDLKAISLLLSMPFLLTLCTMIREGTTNKWFHNRNDCHSALSSQVALTMSNYHLVLDYSLGSHFERKFLEKQKLYAQALRNANEVLMNNMYFCRWCQSLVIGIWIMYGGKQVIDGSLTVGLFVANLKLFGVLSKAFMDLYAVTIDMMNAFPALEAVTILMNYPTDVRRRHDLKRAQRAQTRETRDRCANRMQAMEGCNMDAVPIDTMPIVLNFLSPFKVGSKSVMNFLGKVEVEQGQLVGVVGPTGCGKATLLHLIAGSVLPAEGEEVPVFVPAHLRVANVAEEALFFDGTLFENLIFGMPEMHPDASLERVKAICRTLMRNHVITDYLDEDQELAWQDVLSGVQRKLVMLARALIHNFEVMCIHQPLAGFANKDSRAVIKVLHEHIDSRGLVISSDPAKRRPRTVFISAATQESVESSDSVLLIDPERLPNLRWVGRPSMRVYL